MTSGPTDSTVPGRTRAELRGQLAGVAQIIGSGGDELRLDDLVAAKDVDTAKRLDEATAAAVEAVDALPDSVADAFEDTDALVDAQKKVAALKVLVSTEVASQLGVTISFSDADGDS
jgi:predicted lipoprotein